MFAIIEIIIDFNTYTSALNFDRPFGIPIKDLGGNSDICLDVHFILMYIVVRTRMFKSDLDTQKIMIELIHRKIPTYICSKMREYSVNDYVNMLLVTCAIRKWI